MYMACSSCALYSKLDFFVSETGIGDAIKILAKVRQVSIVIKRKINAKLSQNLVIKKLSSRTYHAGCQTYVRLAGKDFVCLH